MYSGHWLGGGFFWIFCLLMIIAVIWIIKKLAGGSGTPGEIDKKAFDAGKKDSVP